MFRSTMRNSVLQTVLISLAYNLFHHYFDANFIDTIRQDETFQSAENPLIVPKNISAFNHGHFSYGGIFLTYVPLYENATAHNGTLGATTGDQRVLESYYQRELPRGIVIVLIMSSLQYCWFIWLEKMFPARPRLKEVPPQGYEKVEKYEVREEEVVKKWLAQGKVRRALLNWCNTFLKWVINLTIGRIWKIIHLLWDILNATNVSFRPLCTLLAFILAPAHKQIVFINGAEFVLNVFITMALNAIVPAFVRSDFGQQIIMNFTRIYEQDEEFKRWKDAQVAGKEL
ncbi:hypothetical protein DM02DRAFT_516207 [Periconia macrospinosa]|uniref:Uncharacterized protein n=1 Tax=Periconia macrospinosa TaxID=97972 RepID=A0A2V1E7Y8_9PLEO|nr:hypothetical protein DM02DRAFT_516207 [Periconia macrospinosa]